jgi:hypothetical protein
MKRHLLLAVLALAPCACAQPVAAIALNPNVPVAEANPAFPLRVHLFSVRWGGLSYRNHGYGQGNLLSPSSAQGFDFGFECEVPFVPNEAPTDTYQARWKRQPYELEILTAEVGSGHTQTCKLDLALEARPFDPSNRAHFDHGVSSSLRVPWQDPDFAYEGHAPDFPVQFHVIDGQRKEDNYGDHGWGTANLFDPAPGTPRQGADFQYDCSHGFITSSQYDGYYPARWLKLGLQLELLLQRPGSDKIDKCTVTVTLHPDPYPERKSAQ